jgi:hypothetical protein
MRCLCGATLMGLSCDALLMAEIFLVVFVIGGVGFSPDDAGGGLLGFLSSADRLSRGQGAGCTWGFEVAMQRGVTISRLIGLLLVVDNAVVVWGPPSYTMEGLSFGVSPIFARDLLCSDLSPHSAVPSLSV